MILSSVIRPPDILLPLSHKGFLPFSKGRAGPLTGPAGFVLAKAVPITLGKPWIAIALYNIAVALLWFALSGFAPDRRIETAL